jgi:hypothetical protein
MKAVDRAHTLGGMLLIPILEIVEVISDIFIAFILSGEECAKG